MFIPQIAGEMPDIPWALASTPPDPTSLDQNADIPFAEGFKHALRQYTAAFAKLGIEDIEAALRYTAEVNIPEGADEAVSLVIKSCDQAHATLPEDFKTLTEMPVYDHLYAGCQAIVALHNHVSYLSGGNHTSISALMASFSAPNRLILTPASSYRWGTRLQAQLPLMRLLHSDNLFHKQGAIGELERFLTAWLSQFYHAAASAVAELELPPSQYFNTGLTAVYLPLTVPTRGYTESHTVEEHFGHLWAGIYRFGKARVAQGTEDRASSLTRDDLNEALQPFWGLPQCIPALRQFSMISTRDLIHGPTHSRLWYMILATPILQQIAENEQQQREANGVTPPEPETSGLLYLPAEDWGISLPDYTDLPTSMRLFSGELAQGHLQPKFQENETFKAFPQGMHALKLAHPATPLLPFFIRRTEFMELEMVFPTTHKTINNLLTMYGLPQNRHPAQYTGLVSALMDLAVPSHRQILIQGFRHTTTGPPGWQLLMLQSAQRASCRMRYRASNLVSIATLTDTDMPESKAWLPDNVFLALSFFPRPQTVISTLATYTEGLTALT